MSRLKNQVAIVTGSGKGIGKGIAKAFIDQGATVVIATKEYDEGKSTEKELIGLGGKCLFVKTDVESEESIKEMIKVTINKFGKINTLVNNAGITLFKSMEEVTVEDWDKVINIDLRGTFLCTKYAVSQMIHQTSGGSIINISSNHAFSTLPDTEIYSAAKGGVNAMSRSMALSLGDKGIRVNAICPGFTETSHYRNWLNEKDNPDKVHEEVQKLHALQGMCKPEDIANLAVFLASDESSQMTGESIVLDGGLSTHLYHSDIC